ncbi:uncharacterized protein BYT42DRAFT_321489 [Radiomyces spectabilis]|uniref:uncharacterized protein n=1 Tax=Radiomyces spectabilis TaxID=64574 RepID=UPI00221F9C3D|nr:uncharacterized protein BYT42DRAFT_321489 [Radiomyces spectabilis]KAI8379287.1 hypothetical protein BYT42DRAFT_321489 [Radiomyces spectabilis]
MMPSIFFHLLSIAPVCLSMITSKENDYSNISNYLRRKKLQYELLTAVYVMEPWEQLVFNTIMAIVVFLTVKAALQLMPAVVNQTAAAFF